MRSGVLKASVGVLLLLSVLACEGSAGKRVVVVFGNAEGITGGESAYLGGIGIGRTEKPYADHGKIAVPLQLAPEHREALTPGTVFLLTADAARPGRLCLVGYPILHPDGLPSGTYLGASNRLELATMVGVEKAKSLWDSLTK